MIKTYEVQDDFNPDKIHVFRVYKDHHVTYNQKIGGHLFYSHAVRINRNHGYYDYFKKACK